MRVLLERAYGRLGPRYPRVSLLVLLPAGSLVGLVGYVIMSLYIDMSVGQFVQLLVAELLVWVVDAAIALRFALPRIEPAASWLRGERDATTTLAAWSAAASLPLQILRSRVLYVSAAILSLAWDVYSAWVLELPAYAVPILFAGCFLTYLYWVVVRFLSTERVLRPALEQIAEVLPDEAELPAVSVPLRGRLVATLPALVVMTGAVVPGISFGASTEVESLGIAILAAAIVALTVAIPMIDLLSDSVVTPIAELERATLRVRKGDLETRVPIFSTDEIGNLARSFNEMVAGLAERERIREAFGTYVDREVAEHILREGTSLEGEEVEVTIMFIDIFGEDIPQPDPGPLRASNERSANWVRYTGQDRVLLDQRKAPLKLVEGEHQRPIDQALHREEPPVCLHRRINEVDVDHVVIGNARHLGREPRDGGKRWSVRYTRTALRGADRHVRVWPREPAGEAS